MVVVDQVAGGITEAIGDAPAQGLARTGKDLGLAGTVLSLNTRVGDSIAEATGFDDRDKAIADLALDRGGVLDRVDFARPGTLKHGPEAFAHPGGIDNEVEGSPLLYEGFELPEDGQMIDPGPGMTLDDTVGGGPEQLKGGEVDLDDGEGNRIAGGIGERQVIVESQAGGDGDEGLVLPGDIEEESSHTAAT